MTPSDGKVIPVKVLKDERQLVMKSKAWKRCFFLLFCFFFRYIIDLEDGTANVCYLHVFVHRLI